MTPVGRSAHLTVRAVALVIADLVTTALGGWRAATMATAKPDQSTLVVNGVSSTLMTAQGMGPWETFTASVNGGAGGAQEAPGDYSYGDQRRPLTQAGLWGLQRVLPTGTLPCPVRCVDNSTC